MNGAARRAMYGVKLPHVPTPDGQLESRFDEVVELERVARRAESAARKARRAADQARTVYDNDLRLVNHYGGLPLEGLD